jgi:hypothetical protein
MIKCQDKNKFNCFSRDFKLKVKYPDSDAAINKAKELNKANKNLYTKLVAYKCNECNYYHLTTKQLRVR